MGASSPGPLTRYRLALRARHVVPTVYKKSPSLLLAAPPVRSFAVISSYQSAAASEIVKALVQELRNTVITLSFISNSDYSYVNFFSKVLLAI